MPGNILVWLGDIDTYRGIAYLLRSGRKDGEELEAYARRSFPFPVDAKCVDFEYDASVKGYEVNFEVSK